MLRKSPTFNHILKANPHDRHDPPVLPQKRLLQPELDVVEIVLADRDRASHGPLVEDNANLLVKGAASYAAPRWLIHDDACVHACL